jgi:hypothetical protein
MPSHRRRPTRVAALPALLGLLAMLAGACAEPEPGPPGPPVAAPPDGTPARVQQALAALPRGWSDLPPPPEGPAGGAVTVWAGTSLFLWGGEDGRGGPSRGRGWLFDPVERGWRTTAPTAFPGRSRPATAWTGREVLIWGGDVDLGAFGDGAAYDPAADVWRPLAPAPGALNQGTSAWTGRELLVVGSRLDGGNRSRTANAVGLSYDPAADRWRKLPRTGLSPQASAVAWTGRELLAWDYELRAAAYDPDDDRWRRLSEVPLRESECYPQGAAAGWFVFAHFCGEHAVWDQRSRRWDRVGGDPLLGGPVVAAGPVFLFAGTRDGPTGPGPGRLAAYNPG